MRKSLATAMALTLGLALTSGVRADDTTDKDKDQKQSDSAHSQTIHGLVAGVTVEGETAVDYESNKAVMLEAAYLTVVGAPGHGRQGGVDRNRDRNANRDGATAKSDDHNRDDASGGGRRNVYLVWLSPKTKVCSSDGPNGDKKECSLDKLEVGDRVEIQMSRRDESSNNRQGNPTESMRKKHGRHRIYVGDATEITILSSPRENRGNANASSRDNDKGGDQDDKDASKGEKNDDQDNKDKDDK